MTFNQIVEIAEGRGFKVQFLEHSFHLEYDRKDGIGVELCFPTEKSLIDLKEGVNIDWEYKLIDNKTELELYKDRIDIYRGAPEEKMNSLKNELLDFIDKIVTKKIIVEEKSIITVFGYKFLKYNEMVFVDNDD